ncbi:MAG: glycosyltransferase family 2 protein [Deltaproteobacteria bacterium]|nr:glycosyltransferase family 2 protein [Deltaproteobacteria bacterium]
MKLVIQIPCHNEEATLPATLEDLPREVEGFDEVEILVIDDGSTDRTAEVALRHGVGHLVRLSARQGLARAFAAGIDEALELGADVIVNTDGDNQYDGGAVEPLVRPILEGRADMVVGERWGEGVEEFSPVKKGLQKLGSWVVSKVSGLDVGDAASGFRAFSREVAQVLEVRDRFTYTLETLIQAGAQGVKVSTVPVRTNPKTRESRLCPSMWRYVARSAGTVLRAHARHRPGRTAVGLLLLGLAAGRLSRSVPVPDAMGGPLVGLLCLLLSRPCALWTNVLLGHRKRMLWRAETSRVEAFTPPGP